MTLQSRFASAMATILAGAHPDRICVAVSGGGDSAALLALACDWAGGTTQIDAVTVDHGLRPESAGEAAFVAKIAHNLGARHTVLRWQNWDGQGNLQGQARAARRRLITDHCKAQGIAAVLLGHTLDDQAETVLMRLVRGSGVDGLSAMSEGRFGHDMFLRPLLRESRQDLRDYLRTQNMDWIDDPSNDDSRFERVRIRHAIEQLGLDKQRLSDTAFAMARAREALDQRAFDVAQQIVTDQNGILSFDAEALAKTEAETRLRLVAHGLKCLSGAPYRPRLAALTAILDAALAGQGGTLHGCRIIPFRDRLLIVREYQSVQTITKAAGAPGHWDGRWQIDAPNMQGATIRALGEDGMRQMPRPQGLPHAALTSYPGVWEGQILRAVPGFFNENRVVAHYAASASFHQMILSH